MHNLTISQPAATMTSREIAKLSRDRNMPIGDVSDPLFGTVHTYHISVLNDIRL